MAASEPNIPKTQKALQWVRVSDTNPFEWTTSASVRDASQLGSNQVLIENHAVSLNPIDYKMAATNFAKVTLPAATGFDVSGRIVAIGSDVKDFKVGDEVFGLLDLNSSNGGGALQQYSATITDGLVKKPAGISHEDACTLGAAFLSAVVRYFHSSEWWAHSRHSACCFQDALRQVNIDSSTSVFIPGGSGGVGHFSVQLARIHGAKQVITSASKDDGIRILKEQYNVNDVINHGKENVVERVRELTQGRGADVVYDSTYLESSFAKSIQTVKADGAWIILGHYAPEGSEEAKRVAEQKVKFIRADLGKYWFPPGREQLRGFTQKYLTQGAQWIVEGKLKPYISRTVRLEDAQDALEQLKQGKGGFGKTVVKIL